MKKIICLMLILGLVLGLSACGKSNVQAIADAVGKNNEVQSMAFEMKLKGKFTLTGMEDVLPAEMPAAQLESMLNAMKVEYEGKSITDKKTNASQMEMAFAISIMGQQIESQMWTRTDGIIVESITKNFSMMGMEAPEKEYTVTRMPAANVGKATQEDMNKILNDFVLENSKDDKFIQKVEDKHYKVHVDRDKCVALFERIMDTVLSSTETWGSATGVDIQAQSAQAMKIIPLIIGDDGIDIELFIDDSGYVDQEIVTMDIQINLAELAQAMDQPDAGMKGEIGMKLEMNMEMKDFNGVEAIDFPEITEENAVIIE